MNFPVLQTIITCAGQAEIATIHPASVRVRLWHARRKCIIGPNFFVVHSSVAV